MNMNKSIHFSFQNISSCRNELMGIGIIGVLLNHLVLLSHIHGCLEVVLSTTWHLVFTEGFLLLSGFGLFWSLTKQNDTRQFLLRRIKRFLIPFFLLSAPFFLTQMLLKDESFFIYALRQTSIGFWIFGNYSGMWYIAISLMLYLTFPLCYKTIQLDNTKKTIFLLLCYILGWYVVNTILNMVTPGYYQMVKVGLVQIPAFYVGVLFGFLSYKKYSIDRKYMLLGGGNLCFIPVCQQIHFRYKFNSYAL